MALMTGCEKETRPAGLIRPVVKGVETKSGPVIIDDNASYSGKPGANSEKLSTKGFVMDAWLESEGYDYQASAVAPVHYINNAAVTFSSGWAIAGSPKWVDSTPTRFWCWNSLATSSGLNTGLSYSETSDSRNFSFQIPANAADRRDIVMAYTKKTWTETPHDDDVNLRFHHPLANICFMITDGLSSNSNLEIAGIALNNIYTQGTFSYTGSGDVSESAQTAVFSWTPTGTKGNVTETAGVSKANIRKINFFVPPQNLSASTMLSVTFLRTDGTTVTRDVSVYSSTDASMQQWSADSYYCYRIDATDALNQPIAFTISLAAWETYTEESGDLTLRY